MHAFDSEAWGASGLQKLASESSQNWLVRTCLESGVGLKGSTQKQPEPAVLTQRRQNLQPQQPQQQQQQQTKEDRL